MSISTYHSQRLRHTAQHRPALTSTGRAVPAHAAPMEEGEQVEGGPGKHQATRNPCPNPRASRLWAHRLVGLGMALQSVTRGAPGPWDGMPTFARPGARDRGELDRHLPPGLTAQQRLQINKQLFFQKLNEIKRNTGNRWRTSHSKGWRKVKEEALC